MSEQEENFEQMLNESFRTIHTGEVVEGKVIDVKPEEAVLNINYKSDGILTRNEYSNDNTLSFYLHDRDERETVDLEQTWLFF